MNDTLPIDPSKKRLVEIMVDRLVSERAKVAYLLDQLGIREQDLDTTSVQEELKRYEEKARETEKWAS